VDQLAKDVLPAVLGNVGTRLLFRVGGKDAERLVPFLPGLEPGDLTGLPNFTAIGDVLAGDVPLGPFVLETSPPPLASATKNAA